MPTGSSAQNFVSSLQARLAQLDKIAGAGDVDSVWLGGFFQPEAYVTATRQAVAHAKGWSLEQLELHLEMEDTTRESFRIDGKPSPAHSISHPKLIW